MSVSYFVFINLPEGDIKLCNMMRRNTLKFRRYNLFDFQNEFLVMLMMLVFILVLSISHAITTLVYIQRDNINSYPENTLLGVP